ncbi:MAG TPA: FAD-dependent oxidoreductase, partial [Candidatus Bathyarchaeia archaeon]|nr:FAD-dependent oxidoreductase [Candidatus Bathyarchaeia archaeon]
GVTTGYEFSSLLEDIIMVSTGRSGLDPQLEELVREIKEPVHLQVLVTLTCPYCPRMVHVAHQFAFVNGNIRADMIEAQEFPYLAQRYNLYSVPKTIINETQSFEGAIPAETAYLQILKATSPETYAQLEEAVHEVQGARKATKPEAGHEYEIAIVGGGPAAMSAAIYAVRKGLEVLLVAKKIGGQITYTATIENYLGFPKISGTDMAEAFREHMENYSIAEALGSDVTQVREVNNGFEIITENNQQFKAKSVIYCAGKEYKRLGIPGEEQFIGKGIGFCATCDAPLYQGKPVAVVGGGNSALTSVRDLSSFASEIHLIHRRKDFRADAALVQEVLKAKNVTVHTPMVVRDFLGKEKLTGIRLESADSKEKYDLNVEGVFLEIGLTPNTSPLNGLAKLNEQGEISVNRDQSTNVKGLFAAGDATDVQEKQISIAVGQGTQAALSAHKYLLENGLTQSKIAPKENWE